MGRRSCRRFSMSCRKEKRVGHRGAGAGLECQGRLRHFLRAILTGRKRVRRRSAHNENTGATIAKHRGQPPRSNNALPKEHECRMKPHGNASPPKRAPTHTRYGGVVHVGGDRALRKQLCDAVREGAARRVDPHVGDVSAEGLPCKQRGAEALAKHCKSRPSAQRGSEKKEKPVPFIFIVGKERRSGRTVTPLKT